MLIRPPILQRSNMDEILISVVIPSYNSRLTIEKCLNSLLNQRTSQRFEVILIDSSTDGTAELVRCKFPFVRMHHFSGQKFPGEARNIGIAKARGKIIAMIDADCVAAEDWIDQLAVAHESPWSAIGGAIGNDNPASRQGWAAYFCEFSQWMPGTKAGVMADIAAANMSYKRSLFNLYGPLMEGGYCSDTEFHWRLAANGHRLQFVPAIQVSHHNIDQFDRFLRHEFFHGRSFARMRLKFRRCSRLRGTLYAVFWPWIPIKLMLRTTLICLANRRYRHEFLKSFPLVMLGIFSWSLGEASAYMSSIALEKT